MKSKTSNTGKTHGEKVVTTSRFANIQTVRHPSVDDAWIGLVIINGKVYGCTWRGEEPPTIAVVKETWKKERNAFAPYDQSAAKYVNAGPDYGWRKP